MLALGNGTSVEDCFGKNGSFQNQNLEKHVADFEGRYKADNPRMVQLLNNLVEVDMERRESCN